MAYLRGGTVVDGNLYVEGSLRIKSAEDIEGNQFTYIGEDDGSEGRLPVFGRNTAQLLDSNIEQREVDNKPVFTVKKIRSDETIEFSIGNDASTFTVNYSTSIVGKKSNEDSGESEEEYITVSSGDAPELVQYWSY